jgi:hypothetical protein
MTEKEISEALCRRLVEELPLRTVLLENRDSLPARPYVVVELVRVGKTDSTLNGGKAIHRGFLQATVVSKLDVFAGEGLEIAEEVAAVFPYALRFSAGDGQVVIWKPPQVEQSFRDGPDWRTPIRVDYEASQ